MAEHENRVVLKTCVIFQNFAVETGKFSEVKTTSESLETLWCKRVLNITDFQTCVRDVESLVQVSRCELQGVSVRLSVILRYHLIVCMHVSSSQTCAVCGPLWTSS